MESSSRHLMRFLPLLVALAAGAAAAGSPAVDWSFDEGAATAIRVPAWLSADSLRGALGYESGAAIKGFVVDLDGDGTADYLFNYSRDVCGTNCQYAVFDGRTHRWLGLVGGSLVYVRAQRINRWPVINQYGHSSATSGYWSTVVFDGGEYVSVDAVLLQGASLDSLFATLAGVQYGPPPASSR